MIPLTSEHEQLIQTHLSSGRYSSAEEVLTIALQLLAKLETDYTAWIEETRQKIALGLAELDRQEGVDGPTVMNQYLQQFQAAKSNSAS
jgi:antitoxin ParD1/3/4